MSDVFLYPGLSILILLFKEPYRERVLVKREIDETIENVAHFGLA